jgi:hypothetical protein
MRLQRRKLKEPNRLPTDLAHFWVFTCERCGVLAPVEPGHEPDSAPPLTRQRRPSGRR